MTIIFVLLLHAVLHCGIRALQLAEENGRTAHLWPVWPWRREGVRSTLRDPKQGENAKDAGDLLKVQATQTELVCRVKKMMTQLPQQVTKMEGHMRKLTIPKGTCAVVSSSGVLLNHRHGADIDKADFVIRFNDAPVAGFEQLVGSKENMRLVNTQFAEKVMDGNLSMSDGEIYVVTLHGGSSHKWVNDYSAVSQIYPHANIFKDSVALQKSFDEMLREVFVDTMFHGTKDSPTSGAIGMLLALAHCDEVKAYGMANTNASHSASFHYYDSDKKVPDQTADKNKYHQTSNAEKILWRLLATNGDNNVESSEVAVIPGLSKYKCRSSVN